jgi:hypothetical protein
MLINHPIRFHRHTRPIGTFNRHNPARGRASTAHRIGGGNTWNAEDCIARTVVFPLSRHPVSRLAFCGLHQLIFTSHLHCASLAPTQSIFLRVKNNGGSDGHLQRSFSSWDRRTGPGWVSRDPNVCQTRVIARGYSSEVYEVRITTSFPQDIQR